jgi:uncharacterized membrane protein YphA (DoxX/SURF4 family)
MLVAENLGHIKAIGAMTGRNLDPFIGRALLGDSLSTIVSGLGGGTGVTTYAENMGLMAATNIYSTLIFVVAAVVAMLLGFLPKFGALVLSIPNPVLGGLSIVMFGLITAMAGRIWVENRVDFTSPTNLLTVGIAMTALLERHRRGVRATPAGAALVHHAQLVSQQLERMRGELAEYADGLRGRVRPPPVTRWVLSNGHPHRNQPNYLRANSETRPNRTSVVS